MTVILHEQLRRRRYREVVIPHDGQELRFRLQSITQREYQTLLAPLLDIATGQIDPVQQAQFDVRLIVACCVDQDGKPLFSEADIPAIQEWDSAVTSQLVRACQEHIGIAGGQGKNLPKTQSG